MQNPLEKFLLNLAEKIQTEKEYKEIVSNSQSVDVNKDVFAGFVEGISKTIRENLKTPAVSGAPLQQQEQDPLETFLGTLKDKLKEAPVKKPETKAVSVSAVPVTNEQPPQQEKDAFAGFVTNLADIIKKEKSKPVKKVAKVLPDEDNEEQSKQTEEKPVEEPVDDYVKILSTEKKKDKEKEEDDEEDDALKSFVSSYVNKELANFQKEMAEKMEELKDAVEREMMDDGAGDGGGGGTNSYDYYPGGGPMNGNLSFPVSGTGIIFANGQLLSSFPTGGGGGGGGDPAVNSVVYSNSANWNSTYSTVNSYSATWSTGLQDLAFDENTALLSITNGNTVSLSALSGGGGGGGDPAVNNVVYSNSASWISNYTTSNYFSAFWNAAVDELFTFYVTQTSAASAFWTEDGNYYFIQNSKLDNAPLWNNMYTTLYLNSAGWESTETTVRTGSADWNSTYSSLNANSAKYDSVYTTYNQNSASYATEILAIAYAVAL